MRFIPTRTEMKALYALYKVFRCQGNIRAVSNRDRCPFPSEELIRLRFVRTEAEEKLVDAIMAADTFEYISIPKLEELSADQHRKLKRFMRQLDVYGQTKDINAAVEAGRKSEGV